ncbi:MAG: hypothetical protein ACRD0A_14990, partial [Acidimicrobiales bacterium]
MGVRWKGRRLARVRLTRRSVAVGLSLVLVAELLAAGDSAAGAPARPEREWRPPPAAVSPAVTPTPRVPSGSPTPIVGEVEPETRIPLPSVPVLGFDPVTSVEVVDQRSADRTVFRNTDGTLTLQAWGEPRFYQPAGSEAWEPIDNRLVADEDRPGWLRNEANSWTVRFGPVAADGSGGVEIDVDGRTVRFGPSGGSAVPIAPVPGTGDQANTVTYPDAWPGVDLVYRVTGSGVKEELVVRQATRAVFGFRLEGAAFDPDPANPGGLVERGRARDEGGLVVNPPDIVDASGRPVDHEAARPAVAATDEDGGQRLDLTVDPGWLSGLPASAFPIVIDPVIAPGPYHSAAYKWRNGSVVYTCGPCHVQVGDAQEGLVPTLWRSTLAFDYSPADNAITHNATLNLSCYGAAPVACSGSGYTVVGHAFGLNWWQAPGDGTWWGFDDHSYTPTFNLTNLYNSWTSTGIDGGVLGLWGWEEPSPNDFYTYKKFQTVGFSLDFNHPPTAANLSPANPTTAHSVTPTLQAQVTDQNGHNIWYHFRRCQTFDGVNCATTPMEFGHGGPVANGTVMSAAVPAGWMEQNKSYLWWVRVSDTIDLRDGPASRYTTRSDPPPVPAPQSPAADGVVTGLRPTFTSSGVVDPEGDIVSYRFRVTTGSDGQSGRIHESLWQPGPGYTAPEGAVPDGTYWWAVQARDQFDVRSAWSTPVRFRADQRLGVRPTMPYDTMGPVSVNLASGNAVVGYQSRSFATVGDPVGLAFTYNSLGPVPRGLSGGYFADPNGNGTKDTGEPRVLTRVDPQVSFDWGSPGEGPDPGVLDPAHFTTEWTGFITPPANPPANRWVLEVEAGATNCTNVRVGPGPGFQVSGCGSPAPSAPFTIPPGEFTPLFVSYGAKGGVTKLHLRIRPEGAADGTEYPIPPDWLSPTAPALPHGWSRTGDSLGAATYTSLRAINGQVTQLLDDTGAAHVFTWTGAAWAPPPDEDGALTQAPEGSWTLTAEDGYLYGFDPDGRLTEVRSVADAAHPAAPTYTYAEAYPGGPQRMTVITDATGRTIELDYGTPAGNPDCSAPAGYTPPPAGMLCRAAYVGFGGGTTDLYYSNGQLAAVVEPGDGTVGRPTTNFFYDASARLVGIRDVLTNDLLASPTPPFADSEAHRWVLDYDPDGRVTRIRGPEPSPGGARAGHRYEYLAPTVTQVQIDGFTPEAGYARRVELD